MVRNPQLLLVRRILSLLSANLRGMRRETKLKQDLLATDSEGAFLDTDWSRLVELGALKRIDEGFSLAEVSAADWQGPETIEEAFERFRRS
jgi:hypothetical protein